MRIPTAQAEFDALLFGSGYCESCEQHVAKLMMVVARPTDAVEDRHALDLDMPPRGFCADCTMTKFGKKKH